MFVVDSHLGAWIAVLFVFPFLLWHGTVRRDRVIQTFAVVMVLWDSLLLYATRPQPLPVCARCGGPPSDAQR